MKISIIGAGNVGAMLAERILAKNLADVVLVDIVADLAKAKAYDLMDAAPIMGYKNRIRGTEDYKETEGSDIIVITAGLPRRPVMSRDDLIEKNKKIVGHILENTAGFSANAIFVIVTNPLDLLTWFAHKRTKCGRKKIIGMAGNLDTARFKTLLSEELSVPYDLIETFVLGSHGDTMVPLVSRTTVDGKPLTGVLDEKHIKEIVERTKKRGGEIVSLLKSGSAYFSPSAACYEILEAIINDMRKVIPSSCVLEGEYGISDCALGVPAQIGAGGILRILEWELPKDELDSLKNSAKAVKDMLKKCN
ncbi:MAG: malate dehydrogenase [Candidatus Omnitrophica bacterium]|nr:malate dehydrogenase [Candidatus Omnitrophota bacterium]